MILPFRKIAIFDADLIIGHPAPIPEQVRGHLFRWVSTARRRGADAIYFRWKGTGFGVGQYFLSQLAEHPAVAEMTFLITPDLTSDHSRVAMHFGEGIPQPADKADFVQWQGRSCHDAAGIQQAIEGGMDYAFLSPVFSTETHPEAVPLGLIQLAEICSQNPDFPIFALGGVTPENERHCLQSGAAGIAGIRYFL